MTKWTPALSVVLTGVKHSGKSTLAEMLAAECQIPYVDLDHLIETSYRTDRAVPCREIYRQHGKRYFQELEAQAAAMLSQEMSRALVVAALGGGVADNREALRRLGRNCCIVYLEESADVLYERIVRRGLPAFLSPDRPRDDFRELYDRRSLVYRSIAHVVVPLRGLPVPKAYKLMKTKIEEGGYAG